MGTMRKEYLQMVGGTMLLVFSLIVSNLKNENSAYIVLNIQAQILHTHTHI